MQAQPQNPHPPPALLGPVVATEIAELRDYASHWEGVRLKPQPPTLHGWRAVDVMLPGRESELVLASNRDEALDAGAVVLGCDRVRVDVQPLKTTVRG